MKKVVLIHYGELSLKGKNRDLFEIRLKDNIEAATGGRVRRFRGRFVLEGGKVESLNAIFGISWFTEAYLAKKDLISIKKVVMEELCKRTQGKKSFGVYVKRSDKRFPLNSVQVAEQIGHDIVQEYGLDVNLKHPDLRVFIEIADEVYVFFDKKQGLKGLPVGVSGSVLSLLSGGIDSPVASYLMMKRGCEVNYLHFHVFSENDYVKNTKMSRIISRLEGYQPKSKVFLAPYYLFETRMLDEVDTGGHELVLFRRYMVRVAERLAQEHGFKALVTGDSLGQVASQTIDNISLVSSSVSVHLFQPLISYDKQEIVDLSKQIGTYKESIESYKDCCSIVSANPRTRANPSRLLELETRFDIETLVEQTLELITIYQADDFV